MTYLILGLCIFLGVHSIRMMAPNWRLQMRQRLGIVGWMAVYSLASLAGLLLMIWGFGLAREQPTLLWNPPTVLRYLAVPLTMLSFVLVTAAYVPGNSLKSRLHHPMVLGVKVWALAHLLATGTLAHLILFGAILIWSVLNFRSSRQRDRLASTVYPAGNMRATVMTLLVGAVAWAVFAFALHSLLIGIKPLG